MGGGMDKAKHEACNMHVYNMMEKRSQIFKQSWRVDVLLLSVIKRVPFKQCFSPVKLFGRCFFLPEPPFP